MATETLTISVRVYSGSEWKTMSSSSAGYAAFGKLSTGAYRGIEISFKTTKTTTSEFDFRIPQCISAPSGSPATAGNYTWYYCLSTTKVSGAPNTATGNVVSWTSQTVYGNKGTYANAQLKFSASGIKTGTTYYFYVYSTGPESGKSGDGYINYPTAYNYYKEYSLTKPSSCSFNGTKGFYSGGDYCTMQVSTDSSYPYIYASNSSSGNFSYVGQATSGTATIKISSSTSSDNSIAKYFVACDTQLDQLTGITTSQSRVGYVPRLACKIYNGSSSAQSYNTYSHSDLTSTLYKSPYGLLGFTTSASSKSPTYKVTDSSDGDGWHNDMDGGTYYAIHYRSGSTDTDSGFYYYLGTKQAKSTTRTTTTKEAYLYGKGTTSGGSTQISYSPIPSTADYNELYAFDGWASSSNSTSIYSDDYTTAFNDYSTIYAVYKRAGSTSQEDVYYYRGTKNLQTATKTVTIKDSYIYGMGDSSNGSTLTSYSTPTTKHYSDTSYSFVGWATDINSYSSHYGNDSTSAWNNSTNNTIYGVYSKSRSINYYTQIPGDTAMKTTNSIINYIFGEDNTTTNRPTEPSLERDNGYTLAGWATSANETPLTWDAQWDNGATTVYAIWREATQKITLTYDANGGEGGPMSSEQTVNIGSNANFTISSIKPTKKNHDFLGWADNADATTATYTEDSSLSISSNKTIYAVWKLQTYTVTINYNLNGGINGPSSWSQTANVGTNITTTISSIKPTKDRYKFINWLQENTENTYDSDQSVSFSSATTLNLYATWEHLFGADNVYYGIDGEWKLVKTYYGVDGKWVPIKLYYGHDSKWENNT